jgi:hypothetical protein
MSSTRERSGFLIVIDVSLSRYPDFTAYLVKLMASMSPTTPPTRYARVVNEQAMDEIKNS